LTATLPAALPAVTAVDDVMVIHLGCEHTLVVACDSCAGIGDRAGDRVIVSPYVVGRFTCRVPLLELLAVGAQPFLVVATLGVEPYPTGQALLEGVREEASLAGVPPANLLISTEKNIPTGQTAVGVTILGRITGAGLRCGRARPGDLVLAVGVPKVGNEVGLDDPEIADIPTLLLATEFPAVGDLIPVGSEGIAREARKLARRAGLHFAPGGHGVNMDKSAGPSTCFLATVPPAHLDEFYRHMYPSTRPCYPVGRLSPPCP